MQRLREEQREVRIVDIAAGHGRYILEALQGVEPLPESILLRDYSEINVRDGSALIESRASPASPASSRAMPSIAPTWRRCNRSRAWGGFRALRAVRRQPHGRRLLAGLGEALEEGGYLVYTGQPWHPQLELIARALTSHRQGQAWVMRRRTQAEMDQLVAAAGFRKITQRVDQWGIFSVSLAQKVAR